MHAYGKHMLALESPRDLSCGVPFIRRLSRFYGCKFGQY